MARKRTQTPATDNADPRAAIHAALHSAAVKDLGSKGVVTADQFFDSIYGVPIVQNIPLQWLFGVDVLPMESMISVVGPPGCTKSTMVWYLGGLWMGFGGMVSFIDGELKQNPDHIRGIIQNDDLYRLAVLRYPVESTEELLERVHYSAKNHLKLCPTLNIPLMILVDSLGSVGAEEGVKAMEKDGTAGSAAGFLAARNANEITQQLRAFHPKYLAGHPFILVFVNHQKPTMDQPASSFAPVQKSEPGGVHKDFNASFVMEMSKGQSGGNKTEDWADVYITSKKAGLTRTGKKIKTTLHTVTNVDPETGTSSFQVWYDWDETLVFVLQDEKGPVSAADMKNVLQITGTGNNLNCKRLGLKEASRRELGAAIHADSSMTSDVQDLLRIVRKPAYDGSQARPA